MNCVGINKNVNYPPLEDVLHALSEARTYFERIKKNLRGLKPNEVNEVRKMLKIVMEVEAIIFMEISLIRPSVISKKDLASATGIPHATFYRSLKNRKLSLVDLGTICMLLIDPSLKKEFIFIEKTRKLIESKPKHRQEILWVYFISLYFEKEKSPFYHIDLTNLEEITRAYQLALNNNSTHANKLKTV